MSGDYFRVGLRFETPFGSKATWSQVVWADDLMGAVLKAYARRPARSSPASGYRLVEIGGRIADLEEVALPPHWPLMQLWHEGQDGEHDDEPDGQPDEQDDPQVERGAVPRPRQPGE